MRAAHGPAWWREVHEHSAGGIGPTEAIPDGRPVYSYAAYRVYEEAYADCVEGQSTGPQCTSYHNDWLGGDGQGPRGETMGRIKTARATSEHRIGRQNGASASASKCRGLPITTSLRMCVIWAEKTEQIRSRQDQEKETRIGQQEQQTNGAPCTADICRSSSQID